MLARLALWVPLVFCQSETISDVEVVEPSVVERTLEEDESSIAELLQDLFQQQKRVFREEIRHGYSRISEDLSDTEAQPVESDRRTTIMGLGLVIAALVAAWFVYLYLQATDRWAEANERNAALLTTVDEQQELIESQQTFAEQRSSNSAALMATLPVVEWGINQDTSYGYDEIALGDERAQILADLAPRLEDIGFVGIVEFVVHVGRYCSVLGEDGSFALATGDVTLGGCDQLGWPDQEAVMLAERQTLSFANAVAAVNGNTAGSGIEIEVVAMGHRAPAVPYPPETTELLANDWNQAAATNNRVEINLIPR